MFKNKNKKYAQLRGETFCKNFFINFCVSDLQAAFNNRAGESLTKEVLTFLTSLV